MRVAICSVGAELLSGDIVDTNAAWMARRVQESGCEMAAELIVGDEHDAIVEALDWLAGRADVIVVGGGLGPTTDDLTRNAVADIAGADLERRPELVAHLEHIYERLGRPMPAAALRQADVPAGGHVHEPLGSAAGFAVDAEIGGRTIRLHALPGVPWEYKGIAERDVLPELVQRSGGEARVTRTLHVAGMGESAVGEVLEDLTGQLEKAARDPRDPRHGIVLGFLAASEEVLVRITATGVTPQAARERLGPVVQEAADRLGDAVTSVDERRLEDEVARLLRAGGHTVATAESFTGGRIATALTGVPGAASFFRGSVVAYTTPAESRILGVDPGLVDEHGAVSRAVAEAMARAARERFDSDYAVAAVGVAGPAGDTDPDVGTAIWGVAAPDGRVRVGEHFIPSGDRDIIQSRGAAFALESLRRHLVAGRSLDGEAADVTP